MRSHRVLEAARTRFKPADIMYIYMLVTMHVNDMYLNLFQGKDVLNQPIVLCLIRSFKVVDVVYCLSGSSTHPFQIQLPFPIVECFT